MKSDRHFTINGIIYSVVYMGLFLQNIFLSYKTLYVELSGLVKNTIFYALGSEKFFSNTPAFYEQEPFKKGAELNGVYAEFLKEQGIRSDLYLIEYPHPMCFSVGSNFRLSKDSHAAIFMTKGFHEADPSAFSFILAHEMAHIRFADVVMSVVVSLLISLLVMIQASYFLPVWRSAIVGLGFLPLISVYVRPLWMRFREGRADDFAIRCSSLDALKGGIRYFSAIKEYNASISSMNPQYTKEGERTHSLHYPTLASRIIKLNKAVEKKINIKYVPSSEEIAPLVALIQSNDRELQSTLDKLKNPA